MSEQPESNAIVPVPGVNLGGILARDPRDVIAQASEISAALADVIKSQKLYVSISGKDYVKVEGWSTLGAMLGVTAREVSNGTREREDGVVEAEVELCRVRDGVVIGRGTAVVSPDESRWANQPLYARRSMAITRAMGKAYRLAFSWIMVLAGYSPTPAEEMEHVQQGASAPKADSPARAPSNGAARPYSPETVREGIDKRVTAHLGDRATDKQLGLAMGMLNHVFDVESDPEACRRSVLKFLFGHDSANALGGEHTLALLDWLKPTQDSGGAFEPDPMAAKEARSILAARLIEAGQQELPA